MVVLDTGKGKRSLQADKADAASKKEEEALEDDEISFWKTMTMIRMSIWAMTSLTMTTTDDDVSLDDIADVATDDDE